MDTRTKTSILSGLLALGIMAGTSSARAQAPTPISVTGFNRDVIAESTTQSSQGVTPGDLNETWVATGFDGNPSDKGLPAGTTATSAFTNTVTGGKTTFAFQSATANNALLAGYDNTFGPATGTLTFATPGTYSSLAFAVAGLNAQGAGTSTGIITYVGGTTQSFTFDASDWTIGRAGIFNPLIGRAQYADYGSGGMNYYNSQGNVNVYESDVATDPTKLISSVSFSGTYSESPYVPANAGINVFAVSGVAVAAAPEPSAMATLAVGMLGMTGLMLKARKPRRQTVR